MGRNRRIALPGWAEQFLRCLEPLLVMTFFMSSGLSLSIAAFAPATDA